MYLVQYLLTPALTSKVYSKGKRRRRKGFSGFLSELGIPINICWKFSVFSSFSRTTRQKFSLSDQVRSSSPQREIFLRGNLHDSHLAPWVLDRFQTLPRNVYTAAPFGSWNVKCICSIPSANASVSTLSEPAADTNRNLGFPSHSSTQNIQLGTPPGIFVN